MAYLGTLPANRLPCPGSYEAGDFYTADDFDDESISPEQAESDATDELLANPAMLAASLANLCGLDAPIELREADELSVLDGNPNLLLAYAFSGFNDKLRLMAINRLAEFITKNEAALIAERAAQIVAESQQ